MITRRHGSSTPAHLCLLTALSKGRNLSRAVRVSQLLYGSLHLSTRDHARLRALDTQEAAGATLKACTSQREEGKRVGRRWGTPRTDRLQDGGRQQVIKEAKIREARRKRTEERKVKNARGGQK